MIVRTTTGRTVSLISSNKKSLFDADGIEWARYAEGDSQDPFLLAYRETQNNLSVIKLSKEEIKRTINGVHAMLTPTTVEEMRVHTRSLPNNFQWIIDQWPDQKLREILIEAEEKNQNPGAIMEAKAYAVIEAEEAAKREAERQTQREEATGDTGRASEARSAPSRYKNTPKRRTQEGSLSVAFGDKSVVLTPKQLEFMERLSECPEWNTHGVRGSYIASEYAMELSDTMTPMAVGAIITTLREKNLLTTAKTNVGGIRCCVFKLTEDGVQVYGVLSGGRA